MQQIKVVEPDHQFLQMYETVRIHKNQTCSKVQRKYFKISCIAHDCLIVSYWELTYSEAKYPHLYSNIHENNEQLAHGQCKFFARRLCQSKSSHKWNQLHEYGLE